MAQLVGPHVAEREEERPGRGRRHRHTDPTSQEVERRRIVQGGNRHHPELERRIGREARGPERPVQRGRRHHRVGMRRDVPGRVEERWIPDPRVVRIAAEPTVIVLEEILDQARVAHVGLHASQARGDHRVMHHDHADGPHPDGQDEGVPGHAQGSRLGHVLDSYSHRYKPHPPDAPARVRWHSPRWRVGLVSDVCNPGVNHSRDFAE